MISRVYLVGKDEDWNQGEMFPVVCDELPSRLRIIRTNTDPYREQFFRKVNGITIENCPVYFETYKEESE